LEALLKPVDPKYECIAFRAANWAMNPSGNVIRALLENGIRIDTSVFKYGWREGIVSFDYSNAHSELVPWLADKSDICRQSESGKLVEVPIYCERRWIGAFLTPSRFYRARMTRLHSLANDYPGANGISKAVSPVKSLLKKLTILMQRHAWKADFNQCTGRQLIAALKRASQKYTGVKRELPFVLIGHSKQFNRNNERSLKPFLEYVEKNPNLFRFNTFQDARTKSGTGMIVKG
jgi:hypothetical protein